MYTNLTMMKRSLNHLNSDLEKLTGHSLKKCEDPNEANKHFFETFISVYDHFFPKSKSTDKNQKSSQPLDNERNR